MTILVALLQISPFVSDTYSLELGADVLAVAALSHLTSTDNTAVHGAGHAVLLLDVELGEGVV